MTRRRRAVVAFVCISAAALMLGGGAASAGDGIRARRVAAGLDQPVGFTFDPRGRIWYVGKASGGVRVLNLDRHSDRLFYRFSGVSSEGERGALGVALHPDYPRTPFVYVFVTRGPGSHPLENQIVRVRDDGGRGAMRRSSSARPRRPARITMEDASSSDPTACCTRWSATAGWIKGPLRISPTSAARSFG